MFAPLFLFSTFFIVIQAQCPTGAYYYSPTDRCFLVNQQNLTWTDARQYCQQRGGNLASIHSDGENWFIFNITRKLVLPTPPWIGLHKDTWDGNFTWSDKSKLDYTNWYGAPNSYYSCVTQWPQEQWYNFPCGAAASWCAVPKVSCPNGAVGYGGKCYTFVNAAATWASARSNCQSKGGDLVSIHSDAENQFVSSTASSKGLSVFWTGLNKISGSNFTWSDGSTVNYQAWSSSVPSSCSSGSQNCANEDSVSSKWFNCWDCSHALGYVCKTGSSTTQLNYLKENGTLITANQKLRPQRK